MSPEASSKNSPTKRKKRSPLGKRELSPTVTSSNLWITDKALFQETARKRHMTDAELLRDIVHRWCVVERRAPGSQEDIHEQALIDLQKETLTRLENGLKAIVDQLGILVTHTTGFGEMLNLNEALLSRLMNTSNGHCNVSAQTFAALWPLLQLVQRLYVERRVGDLDNEDTYQKVLITSDLIRNEGLDMVQELLKMCGSQAVQNNLISPAAPND
jgi:hypothetical protein